MKLVELMAWRAHMGLTQADAALALDVSLSQYRNYEKGRYPIPGAVALAASALSISKADTKPRRDGRHNKPVDYEALGRPVTLHLRAGELAHQFLPGDWHGIKGDPCFRPRAKTMADALAMMHWPVKRSEEQDDGFHIWIDA